MNKVQFWGYVASIATCISVLSYVIGNFISGLLSFFYSKRYNGELFVWNPNKDILKNYYVVHNEVGYIPYEEEDYISYEEEDYIREKGLDKLMIASESVLLNVKAFYIGYEKDKFKKKDEIFFCDRLSPKECIVFITLLPEGIPNITLEWETPTFMKASLILSYNGKTGNIYESVIYKNTIRSFIIYLFNR